ncbi:camphor resistance protein CrcB [Agreia bicolorata]|uniref:Fluoride-specific ion channel FluC n=1 Tax=Agreia bicolorata TaxID=110935 RepID=A0A1T4Y2W5_9MICO|nr:fluoride efflux transporter CrcB [Agreia bicolorata]SKA95625.1 camphor resistance protein CrcB [Agreia bicolorata]
MTPLLFLALSAAGGIGSVLRLIVDGTIKAHTRTTFPIGTMIINVTGALLLGFVTEIALRDILPDAWRLVIGTGLLGGYTTFSTASFESVRLIQQRRYLSALTNSLGMLGLTIAAALTGAALGSLL